MVAVEEINNQNLLAKSERMEWYLHFVSIVNLFHFPPFGFSFCVSGGRIGEWVFFVVVV